MGWGFREISLISMNHMGQTPGIPAIIQPHVSTRENLKEMFWRIRVTNERKQAPNTDGRQGKDEELWIWRTLGNSPFLWSTNSPPEALNVSRNFSLEGYWREMSYLWQMGRYFWTSYNLTFHGITCPQRTLTGMDTQRWKKDAAIQKVLPKES